MLALGKLLDLTLVGCEPTEGIQLTADGTRLHWLTEGALEVTPIGARDNGVDLLLSAGIHGNETVPIELLERLIRKIVAGTLKPVARVLFLFGNPEAIRRGERYVEQNTSHLFNGHHEEGSGSEAFRAAELERLARVFFSKTKRVHLHYDLYTAIRGSKIEQFALYPWAEGREHSHSELARLYDAGIGAVLLQNKPGITLSAYTYGQLDAEAFTLKLDKVRPFGENQEVNLERLERSLELLIDGSEERPDDSRLDDLKLFSVPREVIKHSDHFRPHLDDDVANFTELSPGYLLTEDIGGTRWAVDGVSTHTIFPNPRMKNDLRAGILVVPAKLWGVSAFPLDHDGALRRSASVATGKISQLPLWSSVERRRIGLFRRTEEPSVPVIDLRSDIVTQPIAGMREAMAAAELGDDVYNEDSTVNRLEAKLTARLGFAAALFVPTGIMNNLLGLMVHCERGDEYIVGQQVHTYKYRGGGAAMLGSIRPQLIDDKVDGSLDLDKVTAAVRADNLHFVGTRLLVLENTMQGKVLPLDYLVAARAFTRAHGLTLHLDDARLYNAAVKLGVDANEITRHFDSVSMCLSKGLGAPVGSMLYGSVELTGKARHWRKMVGGGIRQASLLAATGLYAFNHQVTRLADDHVNAARLDDGLRELGYAVESVQINMVYVDIGERVVALRDFLAEREVRISAVARLRLVIHLDVSAESIG